MTLYELSKEHQELEEALYENGGELTEELATLLDANMASTEAKLTAYNHIIRNLEATENGVDAEIKRLQGIKKSAQNAKNNIKAHLLFVMQTLGIQKIDAETCKASIRKSTSLEVDEDALLEQYLPKLEQIALILPPYITMEAKVSKTTIKSMFKGTDALPAGCQLIENESVTLR